MTIRLTDRRRVGTTSLEVPAFGFGAAHFGGMYSRVSGTVARETLQAAWDGGVRYYDTAPWYGRGLSEHRVGDFLVDQPRDQFIVSTKIGRVLHRPADPANFDRGPWKYGLNFEVEWDYSYDGVMRAYEQSLLRLALDSVEALIIHDPDKGAHGEMWESRMKDMRESGIKALEELKRSGQIKAVGMGLNATESLEIIAPMVDLDFCIVAMPYTLLDQSSLHTGMQRFTDKGVSVIIGAPYASGILATGPGPDARYRYQVAEPEIQEKVRKIQAVCARHGVSLQAAALQFPLAHPAVVAIIPGGAKPEEVTSNLRYVEEADPRRVLGRAQDRGADRCRCPHAAELTAMSRFTIREVRVYLVESEGKGGDYFQQARGHWLIDTLIANPMSGYEKYKASRQSWGIGVMGSIVVEIETESGENRHRHRLRRRARRLADPAPFQPLPPRRRCPQHRQDVGRDVSRLDAIWPQGAADRGDLGGRPGAVGPARQAAWRGCRRPDRRPLPPGDPLLLHRAGAGCGQGDGLLGRQGAIAARPA